MTLEEKAEEYAEKHAFRIPYDGSNKFYDDVDFKASKEGYLAGVKENGFKIHNLNKDPTDLPKRDERFSTNISIPVLTQDYTHAFYQFDDKKWYSQGNEVKVTMWCEFPQFDLEEQSE